MKESYIAYRRRAIKIAKDFHYNDQVIENLKQANSNNEIERIMANARRNKFAHVY